MCRYKQVATSGEFQVRELHFPQTKHQEALLDLFRLCGRTRLPLVDATDAQIAQLREDLRAGGVAVN